MVSNGSTSAPRRAIGAPVTAHPWEITKVITVPLREPHVGLVIDTPGSMSSFGYALGPIAWVLSTGLREFGGRCAIALFGNGAELLTDGSEPLRLIPGIRTGGGTAFGADAISVIHDPAEATDIVAALRAAGELGGINEIVADGHTIAKRIQRFPLEKR